MTDSLTLSLFEFIVAMISVILALAVAELLLGVARLVENLPRVRFFSAHSVWNVNLFLFTFLHWWSLWTFRDLTWNFGMFFYSLLAPGLMFFAATVINPRNLAGAQTDLAGYFLDIRKPFLTVVTTMMVLSSLDGPLFGTEPAFNSLRAVQALIIALPVWGYLSDSRRI
jgi:hypothetical protein